MSGWLKALLGVEDREIPDGAVTSFEFAHVPGGTMGLLLALLALALVALAFWIYRREGQATRRAKASLATLRALLFVCVLLVILEPVLAVNQIEEVDKSVVLLLDDSLSMSTKDRYQDPVARASVSNAIDREPQQLTRSGIVDLALAKSGFAAGLARQNQVLVFRFSDGLAPHATVPRAAEGATPPPLPPLDPLDPQNLRAARGTNLAAAIRDAVDEVGWDRIAALIVVTDGRANLGPPAEDVAMLLKNKDLRLHTVAVGEAEPPRNLRAIALAGPDRVFRNDPAAFEAQVGARGYDGATVHFERRYADAAGEWEAVSAEPVAFPEGEKPVPLRFTDRPPRTGAVEYRIRMAPQPEESSEKDNEKVFVTRVVEEKVKALLVSGSPAHEYYAVKNVLLRDGTIQLACFLQSAAPEFAQDGDDISLAELPATEKDLFAFDVVLLHDPDGSRLPPDWPALLKRFVSEHRGGVGFVAGNKHTLSLLRDANSENSLAGLLPVVLDLARADMPGVGIGYGAYSKTPFRLVPEPAAFTHPATRFHSDPRSARELVWGRLPPFYWFFPVLNEKPGAVVLARHDDPREIVQPYGARPILAVQRYGGGNVLFLAADETNRWRSVAENVFDRFWVQAVRFLVEGRLAGARRRFRVLLDRDVVDRGDALEVRAEVFDESFRPLKEESVEVEIRLPRGEGADRVTLLPVEGRDGHYAGTYAATREGDHEVRAARAEFRSKDEGDTPAASFVVTQPDREMGDVRTDRALLREVASRSRGLSCEIHELDRLLDPKLIPPASERVVTQGRPVPLWDTWTTIVVVLGLLCAEWVLRKFHRMV